MFIARRWPGRGPGNLTLRVVRPQPGISIIRARGLLDRRAAPGLHRVLNEQLAASWAVLLDLRALADLEPGAVPALVCAAGSAAHGDVGFYLVSASARLHRVLATAGVDEMFEVHSSTESALRVVRDGPSAPAPR